MWCNGCGKHATKKGMMNDHDSSGHAVEARKGVGGSEGLGTALDLKDRLAEG